MRYVVLLALLAACSKTEDTARDKLRQVTGSTQGRCVSETNKEGSVSFCTDGRTLTICTGDDGCIVVNVTNAEVPQ